MIKTFTYKTTINSSKEKVFVTLTDKDLYPRWTLPWGENMTYSGDWKMGTHITFYSELEGGTKAFIDNIILNEAIEMTHVAMVDKDHIEIANLDETMKKWIGSKENYYFKAIDENTTELKVIMITDEVFQEMYDGTFPKALAIIKDMSENN